MAHPGMLFDLDGTLIDSVYEDVLAWHEALLGAGIELSVWRIHRIGTSGGLFVRELARETGRTLDDQDSERLAEAWDTYASGAARPSSPGCEWTYRSPASAGRSGHAELISRSSPW